MGATRDKNSTDGPSKDGKRKARLNELVGLVQSTAKAKGWYSELSAKDGKEFRYATVFVSRTAPGTSTRVTGTFEITCDGNVRIKYHSTSFHNYGLSDLQEAIHHEIGKLQWLQMTSPPPPVATKKYEAISSIENVLRRFHFVVRQLKHRHNDREPFVISDEYDVQDLLRSILFGLFEDVRSEEYSPSYAGGAAKMDFLLKSEKSVIETKFARATLRDKQIGEELLIDIARYASHPDCERLICFVYDPNGFIKNPRGLEIDLSGQHGKILVKAIVVST